MFISNPFFPAWKLLSSLPGQENPHSDKTTPRFFQTRTWMAALELETDVADLFCSSPMMLLLGVMLGWGPLSRWETVTCEGKIGGGGSEQSLLPLPSRPHGLAVTPWLLPVHPWSCPPLGGAVSLRWQLLLVTAAGRRGAAISRHLTHSASRAGSFSGGSSVKTAAVLMPVTCLTITAPCPPGGHPRRGGLVCHVLLPSPAAALLHLRSFLPGD